MHKPRHLPWLIYGSPSLVDECFEIKILYDNERPRFVLPFEDA